MIMAKRITESNQICKNFGQFLRSLFPETKTLRQTQEKLNKRLNCSMSLVILNETCIKEELLPKYTISYDSLANSVSLHIST